MRAWRQWTAIGLLVAAVAVLGALLTPRGNDRPLDPDNAGADGTRAVAQILRRHGVEVTRVTGAAELPARTGADGAATLVVVDSDLLGPAQFERIRATRGRLVLVAPDAVTIDALRLRIRAAGVAPDEVTDPGCADALVAPAGAALAGGHLYVDDVEPAPADPTLGCYPGPDADRDVDRGWSLLDGSLGGRRTTVIGQAGLLTNEHLAEQGNAALALRLLGREPRVVWYVPDPFEIGAGEEPPRTLTDLAPDWYRWLVAQLAVVVLVVMIWRGRRLGALVTEPLAVTVRSEETLEGRASLYRRARARGRAAATLRTAALRRMARRLDLPPDTPPEVAARSVADTVGRPPERVHDVLLGAAPGGDGALVTLARELDDLEAALGGRAGTPDTGAPDTGTPDTGTPDTGTPDTGATPTRADPTSEPPRPEPTRPEPPRPEGLEP